MKKFSFPLLALLAFPVLLSAQELSSTRLALTAAPNVAFAMPKDDLTDYEPQIGFHTRLDAEIRLVNRLWLRFGAGYTQLNYKADIGRQFQWPSQNTNGQYDPTKPAEEYLVHYNYKMLTVPVALRYYFGEKQHFYADLEAGGSIIFPEDGENRLRPNVGLVAGWQANVGGQTWLFVQPAFRLVMNSPTVLKSEKYLSSLGLELGVRRGL